MTAAYSSRQAEDHHVLLFGCLTAAVFEPMKTQVRNTSYRFPARSQHAI